MTTPCPTCGGSVPADVSECPTCGASVPGAAGDRPEDQPPATATSRPLPPPPPPPPGRSSAGPGALSSTERSNWAVGAHLSAFLGLLGGILIFIGPLVVWLLKRDDDEFVRHHAAEALNFNLTMFGVFVVAGILTLATLGLGLFVLAPLGVVLFIAWIALTVIAAVKAANGERYRYPLTVRLIS